MTEKENVIERLKSSGCRMTKQRLMLLDIVFDEDCKNCKEIYLKAHAVDNTVGMATVYRFVNKLEDIGVIGGRDLYRIACGQVKCPSTDTCMVELDNGEILELNGGEFINVLINGLRVMGRMPDDANLVNVFVKPCL